MITPNTPAVQNSPISKNIPCTVYDLMKQVLEDTNLKPEEKRKLLDELRKNNPTDSDRWTYRSAIWLLGAIVCGSILAIYYLSIHQSSNINTEGLIAIGSAAVGGLAGLLNSARNKEG